MIKLPDVQPDQDVLDSLNTFQAEIDKQIGFAAKSASAKTNFSNKNKKGNDVFDKVKKSLTKMCSGARRCVYCEDSFADEVEHIYPKDLYPEKVFDWNNYVYACGPCNGPKNNKFAVFRHDTGAFQIVNPPRGTAATQPPAGEAALINPRVENPLDYCILDLSPGSFKFVILKPKGTKDYLRAKYTFEEILQFNEVARETLREAREHAYGDYKARLFQYVRLRDAGSSQAQLDNMIEQLQKKGHPTVWKEMQRYHKERHLARIDRALDDLFIQAPEALSW
ncbi:aminoglycoside phosphotransferase [Spirosoma sp. HMF3257]|uniref:Aminoglycoside phosphotransferase n=1 Tax=Spirosoma telluris TaxID=2183553 RepID=A0A327NKT0_9BACT|nr:aminoglycoside phosphotransferase [Spirosoma telluris]RAI75413.1 aminoglycoside phosphotransferase [Spirosoma telluris]